MIDIPKVPAKDSKNDSEYIIELESWCNKIYDALRYLTESMEKNNDDK